MIDFLYTALSLASIIAGFVFALYFQIWLILLIINAFRDDGNGGKQVTPVQLIIQARPTLAKLRQVMGKFSI